jgi:hypothetical protein
MLDEPRDPYEFTVRTIEFFVRTHEIKNNKLVCRASPLMNPEELYKQIQLKQKKYILPPFAQIKASVFRWRDLVLNRREEWEHAVVWRKNFAAIDKLAGELTLYINLFIPLV